MKRPFGWKREWTLELFQTYGLDNAEGLANENMTIMIGIIVVTRDTTIGMMIDTMTEDEEVRIEFNLSINNRAIIHVIGQEKDQRGIQDPVVAPKIDQGMIVETAHPIQIIPGVIIRLKGRQDVIIRPTDGRGETIRLKGHLGVTTHPIGHQDGTTRPTNDTRGVITRLINIITTDEGLLHRQIETDTQTQEVTEVERSTMTIVEAIRLMTDLLRLKAEAQTQVIL